MAAKLLEVLCTPEHLQSQTLYDQVLKTISYTYNLKVIEQDLIPPHSF